MGGTNMAEKEIKLSVPNLNPDIVENLRECIETGWVSTGGRFIQQFEKDFSAYVKVTDAVSTQSGTAGLHLALQVLGIGPGDLVLVPTLTFIAAVNPIRYVGAEPLFMDCDYSFCLDMEKLATFLKEECEPTSQGLQHKESGQIVKAVLPVHVFGELCDMEALMNLADAYGLYVIEDATEALGSYYTQGEYKGRHAGTIGHLGVYSFNANKIITTGGGGMVVSQDQALLDQLRYLSLTAKDDGLFFVHNQVGYNYRMLNLQAALGVSQLAELETFIEIKQSNWKRYEEQLHGIPGLTLMPFRKDRRSNHWFYSLYVEEELFGWTRDQLMHQLLDRHIQCRPVWKLNHKQKPYAQCKAYRITQALDYEAHVLNLPCSTHLTTAEVDRVCDAIHQIHLLGK